MLSKCGTRRYRNRWSFFYWTSDSTVPSKGEQSTWCVCRLKNRTEGNKYQLHRHVDSCPVVCHIPPKEPLKQLPTVQWIDWLVNSEERFSWIIGWNTVENWIKTHPMEDYGGELPSGRSPHCSHWCSIIRRCNRASIFTSWLWSGGEIKKCEAIGGLGWPGKGSIQCRRLVSLMFILSAVYPIKANSRKETLVYGHLAAVIDLEEIHGWNVFPLPNITHSQTEGAEPESDCCK